MFLLLNFDLYTQPPHKMGSKSGVEIGSGVIDFYQKFKLDKSETHEAWIVFCITENNTKIEIDTSFPAPAAGKGVDESLNKAHFEQLKEAMTEDKPRYIVFDFKCFREDNSIAEKTGYIFWCPEGAPVKAKMLYASTSDALKKKLSCNVEFQVNDKGDFDYEEMKHKVITKK